MVASVMGGSDVFRVDPDPERPWNEAVAESYNASPAVAAFDKAIAKARKHLGWAEDRSLMTCSWDREEVTAEAFAVLLTLSDKQVMEIAAVVMAEALLHGSGIVEILGSVLEVNMRDHWSPDDTFFELVRDKQAMRGMVPGNGW